MKLSCMIILYGTEQYDNLNQGDIKIIITYTVMSCIVHPVCFPTVNETDQVIQN